LLCQSFHIPTFTISTIYCTGVGFCRGEESSHIEQGRKMLAKLLCCANFFKNFPKKKNYGGIWLRMLLISKTSNGWRITCSARIKAARAEALVQLRASVAHFRGVLEVVALIAKLTPTEALLEEEAAVLNKSQVISSAFAEEESRNGDQTANVVLRLQELWGREPKQPQSMKRPEYLDDLAEAAQMLGQTAKVTGIEEHVDQSQAFFLKTRLSIVYDCPGWSWNSRHQLCLIGLLQIACSFSVLHSQDWAGAVSCCDLVMQTYCNNSIIQILG